TKDVSLTLGPLVANGDAGRRAQVDTETSGQSERRAIGFVVGAVGIASLATGIVTGLMTIGKKNTVDDNCTNRCNGTARDAANAGKTLSAISTITFGIGIAGIGVGSLLVATSFAPAHGTGGAPVVGGIQLARSF